MKILKEPVLIVMDGKFLVHAGQPDGFKKKQIAEYAKKGYQIKTISIQKYRATEWVWYWERKSRQKSKENTNVG